MAPTTISRSLSALRNCSRAFEWHYGMPREPVRNPSRLFARRATSQWDLANRKVFVGEQEVHLTPLEYKLLTTLVKHAGKVLTHRFLLKEVWGPGHAEESHSLRVFMATLR